MQGDYQHYSLMLSCGEVDRGFVVRKKSCRGYFIVVLLLFNESLLHAPDAGTWTALGVALRALGEYRKAEAAYQSALALDGASADAWFNLANLYRDTGREERARSAYRRVGDSAVEPLASKALEQLHLLTPQ